MFIGTVAPNNSSFDKSWTTSYQQVCCHTLVKVFQHFFQISLVLLSCWLKRKANVDQQRLNNPKPKHSPVLQMLPSGLQDSFYLFISLEIPPQIPFLSTWLQNSKWDRIGSGLLFCLENIHTNTSLKKGPHYDWQFSDFFPLNLFDSSLQRLLQLGAEACCSQSQPAATLQDLGTTAGNTMRWFSSADSPSPRIFAWRVQLAIMPTAAHIAAFCRHPALSHVLSGAPSLPLLVSCLVLTWIITLVLHSSHRST